jgi:hypothetical protein
VWAVEEILCVEPMVPPRHLEAAKGDGSVNAPPAASVSVEEKAVRLVLRILSPPL